MKAILNQSNTPPRVEHLILLCFFLSGFTSLIYEIAWLQKLQLVLGHTVYSSSVTLSAFLSGLGLGSFFSSRILQAGINPLSFYLFAELTIGIYAICFYPLLLLLGPIVMEPAMVALQDTMVLSALQFLLCFILVLFPTFLMGTTLPLLVRYLSEHNGRTIKNLYQLYIVNAVGAACGAALTGYVILPELGYRKTILLAAAFNALLFLIGLRASGEKLQALLQKSRKKLQDLRNQRIKSAEYDRRDLGCFLILFVSGFASIVMQIIWHRLTSMAFGSSVYIMPMVITLVLTGVALGSYLSQRLSKKNDFQETTYLLPATGLLVFAGSLLISKLPTALVYIYSTKLSSFWILQLLEFFLLSACILPAAIAIGSLFPIAVQELLTKRINQEIAPLGTGYAVNIAGLISGAFLGSCVLLPLLGLQNLTLCVALILTSSGWIISMILKERRIPVSLLGLLSIAIALNSPNFDRSLLTSGIFLNRFTSTRSSRTQQSTLATSLYLAKKMLVPIIGYKDDQTATISIHKNLELDSGPKPKPQAISFNINGKPDGSTWEDDLITVQLLADFPLLARTDYRSLLTIGLGIGITASRPLETYPALENAVTVEMSQAVVDLARQFFYNYNSRLWSDPREKIVVREAREYLQHTREKFDLIISEPSNVWVAGEANLFTREFFELAKTRLNKDGWMEIWFHSYEIDCKSLVRVFQTVAQSFASIFIFEHGSDLYILASPDQPNPVFHPFPSTLRSLETDFFKLLNIPPDRTRRQSYEQINEANFLMNKSLAAKANGNSELNTDDNQRVQYDAGKSFWQIKNCNLNSLRLEREAERVTFSLSEL
jgi:spermidine synthase